MTTTERPVVTSHMFPPIPDRRFDWCAYRDGDEEGHHYGWGASEAEAVADLMRLEGEMAEADDPAYDEAVLRTREPYTRARGE